MEPPRKPGRPSKGDRTSTSWKLPTALLAALRAEAAARGMTVTDLVVERLAADLPGGPYTTSQQGLDLHTAAS